MRPLILITNDDGIHSPGLHAAAEAALPLGDLLIAAPRYQQTAMSRSMPNSEDTGIIETLSLDIGGAEHRAYAVHGSPAQAVLHAILELAAEKPALCISGINYGENLGTGVTMSGTIGAAIQASVMGVPALAISTETEISVHQAAEYAHIDWATAVHFTAHFAELMLRNPLPVEIGFLNVNVPVTATPDTPVKVTRQSSQGYFRSSKETDRNFDSRYRFPYSIEVEHDLLEADGDIRAFSVERVISVTPMTVDLTARIPLEDWYRKFAG